MEKKIFSVNWFKPEQKGKDAILSEKELGQIDWWCKHYKGGVSYLTYRIMQYFEAKDAGDDEQLKQLEGIIRASLPYFWEEVTNYETEQ
jgi:hypothetical protein